VLNLKTHTFKRSPVSSQKEEAMSLLHSRRLRILLPLVIFLFGCFNSPPSPEIVEPQRANVVVMGETAHLAPGSKASFLVQVRDPYAAPGDAILANRQVEVFLDDGAQTQPLFTGHTDDAGLVNVAFLTPEQGESGQQTLIIRAATDGQESVITQDVYIGRAYAVLITTDKPVYQPGQVIHLRTGARHARPARRRHADRHADRRRPARQQAAATRAANQPIRRRQRGLHPRQPGDLRRLPDHG
jgi:hypothetical protein